MQPKILLILTSIIRSSSFKLGCTWTKKNPPFVNYVHYYYHGIRLPIVHIRLAQVAMHTLPLLLTYVSIQFYSWHWKRWLTSTHGTLFLSLCAWSTPWNNIGSMTMIQRSNFVAEWTPMKYSEAWMMIIMLLLEWIMLFSTVFFQIYVTLGLMSTIMTSTTMLISAK